MTTYDAQILNAAGVPPVIFDDVMIRRTITGLLSSQVLLKAWFTVKQRFTHLDEEAILQVEVTTTPTAAGQITDDGTGTTSAVVEFRVAGTAAYANVVAGKSYVYDIQLLLTDGTIGTIEVGTVSWAREVTKARV